ncbi:MAG: NAD(P)/FAD-dependent oxidoreductase [Oscillospiraceae bacterium]|jgi:uncharacterized FAD-dependent dehydrogenase
MSIVVSGIRTGIEQPAKEILAQAVKRVGVPRGQVKSAAVSKTSVDARRGKVCFVSSAVVELFSGEAEAVRRCGRADVSLREQQSLELPRGTEPMEAPVVIAGFGPAGMFAALLLSEQGYPVVVLERGQDVDTRTQQVTGFWHSGLLSPECNVQFGEGGAGTFSDGKLTTRIGDARCGYVLEQFVTFGAPPEIRTKAKPHVGTDHLKQVVKAMREHIRQNGGDIRFGCRLDSLKMGKSGLCSVTADGEELQASALVLAIGHSARDTFELLYQEGFVLSPKPFSVGVRIEHLQSEVDKALYHDLAGHPALPQGEYQLSYRRGEEAVYTFCMCPGGFVVPAASEQGGVVVNGMSEFARDQKNANSALVVSVGPDDYGRAPLDGVAFQRELERRAFAMGGNGWKAPAMTVGNYLEGKPGYRFGRIFPSYQLGVASGDFSALFPKRVDDMLKTGLRKFGGRQPGFDAPDAVLTGVETRTSSPLRIERDETLQALRHPGVYPCGEGAGYAGGIMSAAVDGIRVAQAIMARFAPPNR